MDNKVIILARPDMLTEGKLDLSKQFYLMRVSLGDEDFQQLDKYRSGIISSLLQPKRFSLARFDPEPRSDDDNNEGESSAEEQFQLGKEIGMEIMGKTKPSEENNNG